MMERDNANGAEVDQLTMEVAFVRLYESIGSVKNALVDFGEALANIPNIKAEARRLSREDLQRKRRALRSGRVK